jgi:L-fucose mutarotase
MLKTISPLLSPKLLKILAEMGHGDEIVLGDGNFPAASVARRLVRADGHGVPALLDAILPLFPLDSFVPAPALLMDNDNPVCPPAIWAEFEAILARHTGAAPLDKLERFSFYDRARAAYAVVATGETALYANLILKKGVVG